MVFSLRAWLTANSRVAARSECLGQPLQKQMMMLYCVVDSSFWFGCGCGEGRFVSGWGGLDALTAVGWFWSFGEGGMSRTWGFGW